MLGLILLEVSIYDKGDYKTVTKTLHPLAFPLIIQCNGAANYVSNPKACYYKNTGERVPDQRIYVTKRSCTALHDHHNTCYQSDHIHAFKI